MSWAACMPDHLGREDDAFDTALRDHGQPEDDTQHPLQQGEPQHTEAQHAEDPQIAVWCALSDLYLDTDVTMSYDAIADTLACTPFSIETLHQMLMYDVHPALYPNLVVVAGEWAGFDQQWLLDRIATVRRQSRWRRRLTHLHVRWIRDDWRKVAALIVARRAEIADTNPAAQTQDTQA
jgi:hypothetical protein